MIKKTDHGYLVDIRPSGRNGKRYRKILSTKQEATKYERFMKGTYGLVEEWEQVDDKRRLSDLATLWWEAHGKHLKSGKIRKGEIDRAIETLGDPKATDFTAKDFVNFRTERLSSVGANMVNHDLANLRAIFNELKRMGQWEPPNPLQGIRRIKIDEPELSYLDEPEIKALLAELDKYPTSHARITARVCLATGTRWGEAATIKASQIRHGKLHLSGTKNGKNRSIPISTDLQEMVLNAAPLVDGNNTFKRAVKKLDFTFPRGQLTHILRHTFASHFMINGGNIITLQRILGHGTLAMTVRYAHLSPDHLTEVLELNPLTKVST
ncbi:tyrosine-type recombinase/integrase [Reinekea sp.]|jgi:integrase|uniref:phage integrase n=1 Tax=Reinekea sp. TaxID=1970455 RepID=UPI003988A63A